MVEVKQRLIRIKFRKEVKLVAGYGREVFRDWSTTEQAMRDIEEKS